MTTNRRRSIIYVNDDEDAQTPLTFNSLERGNIGDFQKSNSFLYNSQDDTYRLKTMNEIKKVNSNLDKIDEEMETNYQITKEDEEEDELPSGNVIFANLINLNFKEKQLYPLYLITCSYLLFCIIELLFGYYSKSLILMADAAHYFSESSCFGIYIISIYTSRQRATNYMSFGFHRGEIIGVLVRATFLLGFSFWLIFYAVSGFIYKELSNGLIIIIIGVISTLFNLIMGLVLILVGISNDISFSEKDTNCNHQHSKDELNCNSIRKSFTRVVFKGIQSCIIIMAGVFVYFLPSILYIDPICSLLLTFVLLYNACNHIEGCILILMEASPLEFDVDKLKDDLMSVPGVIEVHDIHVWSLSIGKISMSCHLSTTDPQNSLIQARDLIKKKYNITHTTIQVELNNSRIKCKGSLH